MQSVTFVQRRGQGVKSFMKQPFFLVQTHRPLVAYVCLAAVYQTSFHSISIFCICNKGTDPHKVIKAIYSKQQLEMLQPALLLLKCM